MKNLTHLTILVLALFICSTAQATHVMGSDIFYKHISGMKYEITVKYYRDCRGVAFSNPSGASRIKCENGTTSMSLSLSLNAINDITPVCDTIGSPCDPQNTFGTGDGVEEHIYVDTVDFGVAPFNALLSCSG
ncbi:MAG: hypothetical protein KJP21_01315, partial [Bacteroidia bacterium]|nr:hypothetical protein [Bacteroidia bacterium]